MRVGARHALVGRTCAGYALMRRATAGRSLAVRVGAGCEDEGRSRTLDPDRIVLTGTSQADPKNSDRIGPA
ncbi:hypothetical protein TIFTF001_048618 [Ficus carica]|uniref:Uncharacterized protein n=1 Tax=Ficus carica TaxID=3494 RepID=A0AA88CH78_FICCA|nr:hypothetical protein TIFTF001_048618 [Ficus carica]